MTIKGDSEIVGRDLGTVARLLKLEVLRKFSIMWGFVYKHANELSIDIVHQKLNYLKSELLTTTDGMKNSLTSS